MDTINLTKQLDISLTEDFISVNKNKNPSFSSYNGYRYDQKLYVMGQYSLFSRYIVNYLTEVLYKTTAAEYREIAEEMKQNISEEMGIDSETHDPHYMMLCKGFLEQLGIDIYNVQPSIATASFYNDIIQNIKENSGAYAAGMAYALESSAVPELEVTRDMNYQLFIDKNAEIPHQVKNFFESHIDEIEIEHHNRLQKACSNCLETKEEQSDFQKGFYALMTTMDQWWVGLDKEARIIEPNIANQNTLGH